MIEEMSELGELLGKSVLTISLSSWAFATNDPVFRENIATFPDSLFPFSMCCTVEHMGGAEAA